MGVAGRLVPPDGERKGRGSRDVVPSEGSLGLARDTVDGRPDLAVALSTYPAP